MKITDKQLRIIRLVKAICPDVALAGSVGLKAAGLLKREAKDLDFEVSDLLRLDMFFDPLNNEDEEHYDEDEEHRRFTINGEDVCFFKGDSEGDNVTINGLGEVKISDPQKAIKAKAEYLARYTLKELDSPLSEAQAKTKKKHYQDLLIILGDKTKVMKAVLDALAEVAPKIAA